MVLPVWKSNRLSRLALVVALLTFALQGSALGSAPDKRPNVVLILADDLGYGDIGSYGARFIRTPNIDRLAREGTRLTRFFAGANVCSPSRASLMTGRYAVRSGFAKSVLFPFSDYGLDASEHTLAEVMSDAGYATWMVGKWHLGHVDEAWPTRHGFAYFFGLPFSNDMPGVALYRNGEMVESPLDQSAVHAKLIDEAVNLIRNRGEQPFFLYLATVAPHIPLVPGEEYRNRSRAGRYGDVVEQLDEGIGRILYVLEEQGIDENTLVIFTSDNGRAFEGSAGGLRGMKANTWEGAYAVPFIARWPRQLAAGGESGGIAMNIDLLPTIAGIADATLPEDVVLDGRDIFPLLEGSDDSPHEVLYFFDKDKIAAVRSQRWRYVVSTYYSEYQVDHLSEQFHYPLLFDMAAHGQELFNVAPNYPDAEQQMLQYLQRGQAVLEGLPQKETPWPASE